MTPSGTSSKWECTRERSNLVTLNLMRWIATTLGRRIARLVLHPITLYFMLSGRSAAHASSSYLSRVFGRPARWIERYRHIHHFAATILDRVYLLQERFDEFDIEIEGLEHVDAVLKQGHGALLIGAHMGSFEALRALGQSQSGLRVAMVMYEDNARLVNDTLRAIAPQATLHTIALGRLEAMLSLREWLDGGGVAGLLADRTLSQQTSQRSAPVVLPFLGRPAPFSDGPFRLALMMRRQAVFMAGVYDGGRRYTLRFLPLADFRHRPRGSEAQDAAIREALERYVGIVEGLCRESPYNWFNFFDFWADPVRTSADASSHPAPNDNDRLVA